jgi:hypothetical protein
MWVDSSVKLLTEQAVESDSSRVLPPGKVTSSHLSEIEISMSSSCVLDMRSGVWRDDVGGEGGIGMYGGENGLRGDDGGDINSEG